MTNFKELFSHQEAEVSAKKSMKKKDKLSETRRAENELRERLKAEQKEAKERKREEKQQIAQLHREERALSGCQSKRAMKELRQANRRDINNEKFETCEHGIWKCRICNPRHHTGKVNHRDPKAMADTLIAV